MSKSDRKDGELILIDPSDENTDRKLIIAAKLLEDIDPELSREILTRRTTKTEKQ